MTDATLVDIRKYLNILDTENPGTMDVMVEKMQLPVESCYLIHDLIYDIARRVSETETFATLSSMKSQSDTLFDMIKDLTQEIRDVDLKPHLRKDVRTSLLAALKAASGLRSDYAKIISKGMSEEAVGRVLKVLFETLSVVDPVVAVNVRNKCVAAVEEMIVAMPVFPGMDGRETA